ncbi:type II CAAX endopeptidase family protein [Streptomyces griseus]|uniref:Type II CAAX endopeptidase family protein n=1 Tax=Streptomyces stephensoniae TaxID=3375367 RepID=A0ABU2VWC3_9ACTN|nr:type II CAAX endopeptidase family protein [Streptomyces griseus]MDT0489905.1 type II CAAX endopeptidase family protein [Streptomyces griseus]
MNPDVPPPWAPPGDSNEPGGESGESPPQGYGPPPPGPQAYGAPQPGPYGYGPPGYGPPGHGPQWYGPLPPGHGYGPPPGPVRAESGTSYDAQGRNGRGGRFGWLGELSLVVVLVVVGIVVVSLIGAVLAAVLGAGPEEADSEVFFENPVADMAFQLIGIAIGIPVVLWGARYLGKRPAGTVSSVVGRLRRRWLGLCAAVSVPLIILQFGALFAWTWGSEAAEPSGDGFPGWASFLLTLAVLGALVPLQAAAEEYVFRGWLVQVIGRAVRSPWPAVVLASLLFALAHGFGQLSGFILLFYSAMWWGWLVIRTGGLEAVITLHVANNLLALGLAAGFGELASTQTAADAPWQAMVLEFVFAPLYCLIIARLADRRGIERVSP